MKDPYWYDTLYNSGRRDKWPRNHRANGSAGSGIALHLLQSLNPNWFFPYSNMDWHSFYNDLPRTSQDPESASIAILLKTSSCWSGTPYQSKGGPDVLWNETVQGTGRAATTWSSIYSFNSGCHYWLLFSQQLEVSWGSGVLASLEADYDRPFWTSPCCNAVPWINALMQMLPESFVARMAPDVGRFLRAKEVS